MSRPRGNSAQRKIFAAIKEELEACGWTARLDFSKSGGTQHAVVTAPNGTEYRLQVHGTPTSIDATINYARRNARKLVAAHDKRNGK